MSFVLLLGACAIWMVPGKRMLCLRLSPLIVLYAEALIIIQYIYGFRLTEEELPSEKKDEARMYSLKEIGLQKYEFPVEPLAIKVSFSCCRQCVLCDVWDHSCSWSLERVQGNWTPAPPD